MSEQLKKIRLPLADGSVREINVADTESVRREISRQLDGLAPVIEALELASAPNIIPPIDEWPVYGQVTLVGSKMMYTIGSYYQGQRTVLAHLGPLKGQYLFSADFDEDNGASLRIVCENLKWASPIVEIDTENPEKTVSLDIEDAWLVLNLPAYSGRCLVSSAVLKLVTAKENSLAMETHRLGQKVLDLRAADKALADDIKNVSDSLPWAGTLYDFRFFSPTYISRSPAKVFMIFDNDNLSGLYYGGKRIFPAQTQKFSIKGVYKTNDKNVGEFRDNGYSQGFATFPIDPDTGEFDYTTVNSRPWSYEWLFEERPLIALDEITADTFFFKSASHMFYHCNVLERANLSKLDTSNVTNMSYMFYCCSSLSSVDLSNFDTSNVTDMNRMFYGCSSLLSADLSAIDTSKVTTIFLMFCGCTALRTINLTGIDLSAVTNASIFANKCTALTDIIGPVSGISADLSFSSSPLTNESAMVIINGLAEVTAKRTLELSADTYDTLSEQQIALATSKGWTLTRR